MPDASQLGSPLAAPPNPAYDPPSGTRVGWLMLNEIRDGRGAVRGLPLALFATSAWPLLALVCVTWSRG